MNLHSGKKFHFITGLPRSGSTMLTSILNQNPRFHSSITDPLAILVRGVIDNCQEGPGMKFEVPMERRRNLAHGLFESYYANVDKPVIFNTNRAWTYLTHLIQDLYPESKFIICVRDITWILDSFELAYRRDPLNKNTVVGGLSGSVYSRADLLMADDGIIGFAYTGIKQAITGPQRHNCILIEYDKLCQHPEGMITAIYNFLGEEYYQHDFNNIEARWDEYDNEIGLSLHTVRKKVEYIPRQFILPPDLIHKYQNLEVWR